MLLRPLSASSGCRRTFIGLGLAVAMSTAHPLSAQDLGNYFYRPIKPNAQIAIVPVKFSDGPAPFTATALQDSRDTLEQTFGDNIYHVGDYSVVLEQTVALSQPLSNYNETLFWDNGAHIYRDAVAAAPAVFANYDYVILFVRRAYPAGQNTPNGFAQEGLPVAIVTNSLPLAITQQNTADAGDLAMHELGHKLGREHAEFRAPSGELQGYGDHFDPMGTRFQVEPAIPDPLHLNPFSKLNLGIFGENDIYSPTTGAPNLFALQAIEDAPGTHPDAKMVLRVPAGAGQNYFVFLRRDQPLVGTGLMITKNFGTAGTQLLDMNPGTTGAGEWTDACLFPGQVYTDPVADFTVQNLGVTGRTVNVAFQYGASAPVTYDSLPIVNVHSPTVGEAVYTNQVTYLASAFDPDVGTTNGAGLREVTLKLVHEASGAVKASVTYDLTTTTPPSLFSLQIDRQALGLPDFTYRLVVNAISDTGLPPLPDDPATTVLDWHWLL